MFDTSYKIWGVMIDLWLGPFLVEANPITVLYYCRWTERPVGGGLFQDTPWRRVELEDRPPSRRLYRTNCEVFADRNSLTFSFSVAIWHRSPWLWKTSLLSFEMTRMCNCWIFFFFRTKADCWCSMGPVNDKAQETNDIICIKVTFWSQVACWDLCKW